MILLVWYLGQSIHGVRKYNGGHQGLGVVGGCLMATERHFCWMESSGDGLHNKVNVLYTQSTKVVKSVLCVFHHRFDKSECSRSYSCTGSKEPLLGWSIRGAPGGRAVG